MRNRLRRTLRRTFARLASALVAAPRTPGLRILTYHRVNDSHPRDRLTVHPAAFREQMQTVLARGYRVLDLATALPALSGATSLPPEALAVTFDDGYEDNFRVALPILEELDVPATFFVATGLLGTSGTIERYRGCCDDDRMLDWSQVRDMAGRGHGIGGHGRSHRELPALPPPELEAEVGGCAADISARAGSRPRLFCYPRGSESAAVRRSVAAHGFEAACTVYPGANPPGTPVLLLRRTEVSGGDDLADFGLKLRGGYDAWHRLVQASRGRRPAREQR